MNLLVLGSWLGLVGCSLAPAQTTRLPGTRVPTNEQPVEIIFDRGLTTAWHDYGWAPRELAPGQPARVDFSGQQGWIIANPELAGRYAALLFRLNSPREMGDFLEVHLDSGRQDVFPRVKLAPRHRIDGADGWTQVRIPLSELNPESLRYDRIVWVGLPGTRSERVLLDDIALTPDLTPGAVGQTKLEIDAPLSVNLAAHATPISDLIYGIAVQAGQEARDAYFWQLGATARRWGGNPASTYNWKLGNAWSTGNDWFFHNTQIGTEPGYGYRRLLSDDVAAGVKTALTLPMLGWVAKDTTSAAFPVSVFGAQAGQDPYSEAGNGITRAGVPIEPGSPTRTSVAAPSSFIGEWVRQIRKEDEERGGHSVAMYILDNEPGLWNSTHRDVHPQPVSYDELLQRTLDYGAKVREADPQAVIAGPAEWGWPGYFYSAVDAVTKFKLNPDRLAHGNVPLLPWYLRKLHEHQLKTGERILDVLDVHYYPMADGVGGSKGGTDAKTSALRLRSTRSLWDPTYVDESWIGDSVQLIPRLKKWIAENDPGIGISIGEWNFGAEDHISGGLATAEALGRFGQNGVQAAYYWTYPPNHSPAYWAFRAYRNFDGQGGHFLSNSLPTTTVEGASLFASRDDARSRVVLIALNLKPDTALAARIDLKGAGPVASCRAFSYTTEAADFVPIASRIDGHELDATLDPYSITVFDVRLTKP